MKTRILVGVLTVLTLLTAIAPAKELYVRNQPFRDAYFAGSRTYVPLTAFLKATGHKWNVDGDTIMVVEKGPSPAFNATQFTLKSQGKSMDLTGIQRGDRVYVDLKPVAKALGLGVLSNEETGIVDVVKGHLISDADKAAEEELMSAKAEQKAQRREAWEKRVSSHREKVEAEKAAAEAAEEESEDGDEEMTEEGEQSSDSDAEDEPKKTAKKVEEKPAEVAKTAEPEENKEEEEPPPAADLVVYSKDAAPNYYTGDVIFSAVVRNQGNAPAQGVQGRMKVTGPDNRVWISKTFYGPTLAPDANWNIKENYKHRDGPAMPRGTFDISLDLDFKTAGQ